MHIFNSKAEQKCRRKYDCYNGSNFRGEWEVMSSCPEREWSRKAHRAQGIEGCLGLELKNWGGWEGLSWWRKQNKQCPGGVKNWGCAWRRTKSEIWWQCQLQVREPWDKGQKDRQIQFAKALNADLKKLHLVQQTVERQYRASEQLFNWFSFIPPF